jgi:hypothetical protein
MKQSDFHFAEFYRLHYLKFLNSILTKMLKWIVVFRNFYCNFFKILKISNLTGRVSQKLPGF